MGSGDRKEFMEVPRPGPVIVWDPLGPVKLEAIDFILQNFTEQIVKRLGAVEAYLEKGVGQGTPFIRVQERPDVGGAALQDLSENLRKLNERLDKLERRGK